MLFRCGPTIGEDDHIVKIASSLSSRMWWREAGRIPTVIQPEVNLFPECAKQIALQKLPPGRYSVYVASDNEEIAKYVASRLPGRGTWYSDARSRPNGHDDNFDWAKQRQEALVDLFIVARSRFFIGTRESTFSVLAAGMSEQDFHYMVYPGLYDHCIEATSPLNSMSEFDGRFHFYPDFSIHGRLAGLKCVDQEMINEMQALFGAYNPFEVSSVRTPFADALSGGGGHWSLFRRAMIPAGLRGSMQHVRRMIQEYAVLHARMMDPADPIPKRFYYATTHTGNIGNRAISMLVHLLLAMQAKRAILFNPTVLAGFAFPIDVDSEHAPLPFNRVLDPKGTYWMRTEFGFCENYTALSDKTAHFPPPGAPNCVQAFSNPHFRRWIVTHVGASGLRKIMRWFFRPDTETLGAVRAVEISTCGKSPCDIGIHIRRGRVGRTGLESPDGYFPTEYRAARMLHRQSWFSSFLNAAWMPWGKQDQ